MTRLWYYSARFRQPGPDGGGGDYVISHKAYPVDPGCPEGPEVKAPDRTVAELAAILANVTDRGKWSQAVDLAERIRAMEGARG